MATANSKSKTRSPKKFVLDQARLGMIIGMSVCYIIWDALTNYDRPADQFAPLDRGKGKELFDNMTGFGWSKNPEVGMFSVCPVQPVMHEDCPYESGEALIANEMQKRTALWEKLQAADTSDDRNDQTKHALRAFELVFVTQEGASKVLTQLTTENTFWATTGHQRSNAANAARVKRLVGGNMASQAEREVGNDIMIGTDTPEGIEDLTFVNCFSREYENEKERRTEQRQENLGNVTGVCETTPRDRLHVTQRMVRVEGASQEQVRQAYGATEGQRLHRIIVLDGKFPEVGLFKRILESPDDKGKYSDAYIPYSKIPGKDLPKMVTRSSKDSLDTHNRKQEKKAKEQANYTAKILNPFAASDLRDAIKSWLSGEKTKRVLDAKVHENFRDNNVSDLVKLVADAHLKGDVELLGPAATVAVSTNILLALTKTTDGQARILILDEVLAGLVGLSKTAFAKTTKALLADLA